MRTITPWIIVPLLASILSVKCSKILALMTCPSHSHHAWNSVFIKALVEKGHDVTYLNIDEYPNKPPKLRQFFIPNQYVIYEDINITKTALSSPYETIVDLTQWQHATAENLIKQPEFQRFVEKIREERFDLVIYDLASPLFSLGIVDLVGKPPVLGITAFGSPTISYELTGSPFPIENNLHYFFDAKKEMTFLDRFENLIVYLFDSAYFHFVMVRNHNVMAKKAFGPTIRNIDEIMKDIHITLTNNNLATELSHPKGPGLISVAGLHIPQQKPLPKNLKDYLDSAKDGVIYFSLGTNILSSTLNPKIINILTNAFKQLAPLQVLWKWEKDVLPGKPSNVRIEKWLPQTDILAHPNVKLFFTHGGMLSTQESIYHGKPVVGLPVFLDQHTHIKGAVSKGYGVALTFDKLTPEKVVKAIRKVLDNPSYADNAKKTSKIFQDQQNHPLNTAVYWTEYAIRHNGGAHLSPMSKTNSWIENGLYDFFLIVSVIICVILYIAYKIISFIIQFYMNSRNKSKND